jgi:subtilase family serine protease
MASFRSYGLAKPAVAGSASSAKPQIAQSSTQLLGHVLPATSQATQLNVLDPQQQLTLTIHLKKNLSAMQAALNDIYNSKGANYKKFLSSADFESQFCVSPSQMQAEVKRLSSNGFNILSSDVHSIKVQANAGAISSAFQTEIWQFKDSQQNTFFAPLYELQVL